MNTIKFTWKRKNYTVDSKVYTDPNTVIKLPDGKFLAFNGWKPGENQTSEPVSARIITVLDASEIIEDDAARQS